MNDGSSIPEAFERELDRDQSWVKVPLEHLEFVQKTLALIAGEKESA